MEIDPEKRFGALRKPVAAHRLAGFGATELQHMTPGRVLAKIVIEGNHAIDFGARQIEFPRDHRQALLRHIAELVLDFVQNGNKRAFEPLEFADDRQRPFGHVCTRQMDIH